MCGIAGFFFDHPISFEHAYGAMKRMAEALKDRGPDDRGWVLFDGLSFASGRFEDKNERGIDFKRPFGGMVHTRLSILDLTDAGHQPMSSSDGRYWIIYNGEVYNYREIRQRLSNLGWGFTSNSDTEVILKSYIQWGHAAVEKFNGMFAFAIYDTETRRLFCARDRIGIKPFYFARVSGGFIFASDATTLIASGFYEPSVNWEGVKHGLSFQGCLRPMTVYAGVEALNPGSWIEGETPNVRRTSQYWDMPIGEFAAVSEEEAQEQFDVLLHKAIERCLVSDIEVATLMSGGIDSTTMSAIASRCHPDIKAFTLAYDQAANECSELPQAKATAAMNPMTHIITEVSVDDVISSIDEMLWLFEEPIGMLEPHYPIAKHIASHGIKVILNGLGPDELLCGYRYHIDMVRYWLPLRRFSLLSSMLPTVWKFGSLKRLMKSQRPFDLFYNLFSNYLYDKKDIFNDGIVSPEINSLDYMREILLTEIEDPFQAFSYADVKVHIGTHHNHTTDRFLMRFNIEGRFPYLDHELVEFCFKLPGNLKVRSNKGKYILRKLAPNYIHPDCLIMRKQGFSLPERSLMLGHVGEILTDRIAKLRKRDIFKGKVLDEAVRMMRFDNRYAKRALYFANFELWYHWFIERNHPLFAQGTA